MHKLAAFSKLEVDGSMFALDENDNVFFTLIDEHCIRKLDALGAISLFCGSSSVSGPIDGPGSEAKFNNPKGLAFDQENNLLVCDKYNSAIRKINSRGDVVTWIGHEGRTGTIDGPAEIATLNTPHHISFDRSTRNVYFSDLSGMYIRIASPTGFVTTLASGLSCISGLSVDSQSNVVFVGGGSICSISKSGVAETLYEGLPSDHIFEPSMWVDKKDRIFFSTEKKTRSLNRLSTLEICNRLKMVDALTVFPPGVVPLIVSFLPPTSIVSTIYDGKMYECMAKSSRGVLYALAPNSELHRIDLNGFDSKMDIDTTPPLDLLQEHKIDTDRGRLTWPVLSLIEASDETLLEADLMCREFSGVEFENVREMDKIRNRLLLSWATRRDLKRYRDFAPAKYAEFELLRGKVILGKRRGLWKLWSSLEWNKYLARQRVIVETINKIPAAERSPKENEQYARAVKILADEKMRIDNIRSGPLVGCCNQD